MSDESKSETKIGLGGSETPPDGAQETATLHRPEEIAPDAMPPHRPPVDGGKEEPPSPLPPDAPELLVKASRGDVPDSNDKRGDLEEAGALTWLLGATEPIEYDVKATLDTPEGQKPFTFHIRQLDGAVIEALERESMLGEGPFARIDRRNLNAAKCAAATMYMVDETGEKTEPKSEEFRGRIPTPKDAMRERFKFQPGLLAALAVEIDRIAGFTPDRVGVAEKAITIAAGNS
jgi:hypothetical protein